MSNPSPFLPCTQLLAIWAYVDFLGDVLADLPRFTADRAVLGHGVSSLTTNQCLAAKTATQRQFDICSYILRNRASQNQTSAKA